MTRPPSGALRRAWRWTRWLILGLLLPLLLLAGFGQWWLLPRLNDYRDSLAAMLSEMLQVPVQIDTVAGGQDGGRLALRLRGVTLHHPQTGATLAHFSQATAALDLWRSLQEWRPAFSHIRLEGANLTLEQGPDGAPRLRTDASSTETASTLPEIARWLFTVGRLEIFGEQLTVLRPDGTTFNLLHPWFQVRETGNGQQLIFTTELPTERGERLQLTVERAPNPPEVWQWQGQVQFNDGKNQPTFELRQTGTAWQGHFRDWRAEDLLAWLSPWLDESGQHWLVPLDLRGALPDITVQLDPVAESFTATVQFHELASRSVHRLPGFAGLTGTLTISPDGGRLELDSHQLRIDTAGLLRAPITLDTLKGVLNGQRSAQGWTLDSPGIALANPDLTMQVSGSATLPDEGELALNLRGQYHFQIGAVRRYLPFTAIPADGLAWLDQALVSGRATGGEFILRGLPGQFPFDHGEGLLETRFQVENMVLDYTPGWPRLEKLEAAVTFRNRTLQVEASSGRLLDAQVERITARIDDLAESVVQVKGRVKGPSASMWRAFQDSPAGRDLKEDLPNPRWTGTSTLDLELSIPLDPRPNQVRGRVGLLDNGLTLPAWNLDLERLRGEARFTGSGLEAKDLRATLRGESVRLDLVLAGREGRRELQTRLRGRLEISALLGESATLLEPYLSGKADWETLLTIPTGRRDRRDAAPAFALEINSDLRGMTVQLPEPLGKPASEARPLKLRLQPRERETLELTLGYGEETQAVLALVGKPENLRLERGELRINAGVAKAPATPGLTVIANLPRWALTALPALPTTTAVPAGALLNRIDARIDQLLIADQAFPNVTLRANYESDGLRIELDGKTLAGRITAPDQPTPQQPVNIDLQRLHLRRAEPGTPTDRSEPGPEPDPRRLPPLVLTTVDLRLNDVALGQLRLTALPQADDARRFELALHAEQQQISASGEWRRTPNGHASRLQATLHSPAIGETLTAFGYPGAGIARGKTEAELIAQWPAALPDFTLERIEGVLTFQVGPGQLLDLEPGMGRMVGLFNVQNLIRRLSLDFSDLFQPGMGFDQISGAITFKRGQAYTDRLIMDAPAAQMQMQGRIGLQARDYDQQITVTPRLGGALPLAGALAGGPAVGAAVFLAERLLQKGIENITRYRYTLKGSWDNPVLESLQEPTPATPTRAFGGDH
ncbi:MAG: TIGR02099 family protein [Candidatus Contendobacter sp.]|nr:TIGR02099 family protein [Candidatus Contendobacter sp.]